MSCSLQLFGFTSARKMSSCVIKRADNYRLYNKGAAEWVLKRCTHFVDSFGDVAVMTAADRENIEGMVVSMAQRGLRCICLARTDYPLEDGSRKDEFFEDPDNLDKNLVAIAIVGIKDPVRKEVSTRQHACQVCEG